MSIEQANCIRRFKRICGDGYDQGWHERNGGNLTYRMNQEDIDVCMPYFDLDEPNGHEHQWHQMPVQADNLAGAFFITTGAGKYMRKVNIDLMENVGIVEINAAGDAWRIVWGLTGGGQPTSEFPTHFMNHSVRMDATNDENRVIYHAHCPNVTALSMLLEPTSREWSRTLWRTMIECILVFPEGVGVVPWMVPGGAMIASNTSVQMAKFPACVWTQHGLFVSGESFDAAFGLMHTIEKTAQMYLTARAASGGQEPEFMMNDAQLKEVCKYSGVKPNLEFLD